MIYGFLWYSWYIDYIEPIFWYNYGDMFYPYYECLHLHQISTGVPFLEAEPPSHHVEVWANVWDVFFGKGKEKW